jgi:hypothetical protein
MKLLMYFERATKFCRRKLFILVSYTHSMYVCAMDLAERRFREKRSFSKV